MNSKSFNNFVAIISVVAIQYFAVPVVLAAVNQDTQQAVSDLGAASATEIKFEPGQTEITAEAQAELKRVIDESRKNGEIKKIEVAVWADQEYPADKNKAPKAAKDLAKKRAENLEKHLEKNLYVKEVKIFNMADRPNVIQKAFRTTALKTKEALEKTGAAPTHENETGLFGLKGKASQAVVMIFQDNKSKK